MAYKKITFFLLLFFTIGFVKAQNIPHDSTTYDKSKHLIKLTREIPTQRMLKECVFFKGDSLNGFDMADALNDLIPTYHIYRELKVNMFRREAAFIKKKYGIVQLPYEIIASQKSSNPNAVLSGPCSNVDFETGNFTGWTGKVGYNALSTNPITVTSTGISTGGVNSDWRSCSYHTLETAAGVNDYYGNFPVLDPGGGSYAVRLGGENANVYDGTDCNNLFICHSPAPGPATNCGGESLEQTFTVGATNTMFTYKYAAVLNDGGHPAGHQPYFSIQVFNSSGALISCLSQRIELVSGVAPAGGVLSANGNCWFPPSMTDYNVYYIPWQSNSFNLNPYIGQNITVKFTAAGCTDGDHFCYAYFDATCGPVQITPSNASPCTGQTTTLTAPASISGIYSWSGPGIVGANNTQTISINASGTYTVTVGSGACSYTLSIPVTFSPGTTPTINSNQPSICSGTGTNVILTASGCTSYTWSANAGSVTTSTTSVSPNVTTTYTVTGSSGGCSIPSTITVSVTPTPTVAITGPTSVCPGSSVTLTGATATNYTWSPGGATTNTISVSPASNTTYTLTGANGTCTASTTANITINSLAVTVNSPTVCNGSSVAITANGATTYSWFPATGLSATTGASVNASPSSTTVYTVTGTTGTCSASATSTVTVNPATPITVNSATICNGNSATLTANGATTYSWSPATGLSATTGASVTANPATTTIYTVTVTGGTCPSTASSTVSVSPGAPITINSPSYCIGGSASLTAGGAVTYTWSPATGLSAINGASITANPAVTTNYTVTGTDVAGCINSSTTAVTVNPLPTISVNNGVVCNGGSAALNANGAATYTWIPASGLSATTGANVTANPSSTSSYTITGTDANGCISNTTTTVSVISNPTITVNTASICSGTSATLTASGVNNYTWSPGTGLSSTTTASVNANPNSTTIYTITGSAGSCTAVVTTTVTVNPLPVVSANTGNICVGNSTTLTSNGALTYTWSPVTGLNTSTGNSVTANPATTTQYTVTGTDANGCANSFATSVTVNPLPVVTVNSATICSGSSTILTAAGAATYAWNPATGLSSGAGNPVTANPATNSSYTVTGTDANNCVGTAVSTVNVILSQTANAGQDVAICAGGSATLTGSGGGNYSWSIGSNSPSITVLPNITTSYVLTVSSGGGCSAKDTVVVYVKTPPSVTINSANVTCFGLSNGTATATVNGGTAPFNYNWQPGSINNLSVSNLGPGTYSFSVYDSVGCSSSQNVTITQPSQLSVTISGNNNICAGQSVLLSANAVGGTFPFTYHWGNGTSSSALSVTPTGNTTYSLGVTDGNNCSTAALYTVTVNPKPVASFTGSDSGCVPVTVSYINSSIGAVSYIWSFGNGQTSSQTNPTEIYNVQGIYNVSLVAVSANGCRDSITKSGLIYVMPAPVAYLTVLNAVLTELEPTTSFYFSTLNSSTCSLNFGDGTSTNLCGSNGLSHTYNDTGKFCAILTATNTYGCTDTKEVCLLVEPDWAFYVPNAFSPEGDGLNDSFTGYGFNFSDFHMLIFDRWGNQIFETHDYSVRWKGTVKGGTEIAQEDTYVYKIELKDIKGLKHMYKGVVNLVK